jgi:SAM-dependent methyltransferase
MPKTQPFEKYAEEYDEWFNRHPDLYMAELKTIRSLIPEFAKGLEIGVGTGQFAAPLHIQTGVEPSLKMAEKAREKGIQVYAGTAERLPFSDKKFDLALMVTTICFVDDIHQSFLETYRVLKEDGHLLLGFIDKDSELGKTYQAKRSRSRFYKDAVFISTTEVLNIMEKTGFEAEKIRQALLPGNPPDLIQSGFGDGSFVAVRGKKTK